MSHSRAFNRGGGGGGDESEFELCVVCKRAISASQMTNANTVHVITCLAASDQKFFVHVECLRKIKESEGEKPAHPICMGRGRGGEPCVFMDPDEIK